MTTENQCLPPCDEFNMVLRLTDELSQSDDKIIELERIIEVYKKDTMNVHKVLWVKDTFIEYCMSGYAPSNHFALCEFFRDRIIERYNTNHPSDCYEVFVKMLTEILEIDVCFLKTECDIRDEIKCEAGEEEYDEKWKDADIEDIIFYHEYELNSMFYKLPFKNNSGEKVWMRVVTKNQD